MFGWFKSAWLNDYFCDAALVYVFTENEAAKLAALAAGKTAAGEQRNSMILYLRGMSSDMREETSPELMQASTRLNELEADLSKKNWTLKDIMQAKNLLLSKADPAALAALNQSDSSYFRTKFPQIFDG